MELTYKIKPWSHQKETIERCEDKNAFAIFHEVGTGKTATMINIMRQKFYQNGRMLKVLIVCPLVVCENWRREIVLHAAENLSKGVLVATGNDKEKIKTFENDFKSIFITNIDSLARPLVWEAIKKRDWEMLILDESHQAKTPSAKRTKKIIALSRKTKYRFLMTGTPAPNSLLDLWSQFMILSPGILGDDYFSFRNRWFMDENKNWKGKKSFPKWVIKPGSQDKVDRLINPHCSKVKKKDVLDLPPLVFSNRFVELTGQQKQHYQDMERDFITYINDKACVAELAMTKLQRLQQILCGIVKTEDGKIHKIPCAKKVAIEELLESITTSDKVIIWTNFIDTYTDLFEICKKLKIKYNSIVGKQSNEVRQRNIDLFSEDEEYRVMIANQQAGGIGINLVSASYMIYYGKTFNSVHDIQSEGRAYRGGSERHSKITRIDLITKGTVDEQVTTALREKAELNNFLLTLRKHYG